MKYRVSARGLAAMAAALLCVPAARGSWQEPQESSSKRPPEEGAERTKPAAPGGPAQPRFDPLRAEKDVEVGNYYMRKGNLDAAMDRFQDAIEARPNFGLPYRLLGEVQEKKGLKREAVLSYTRYLEVFPHAEDAEKVRRRIERLQGARKARRYKISE